MKNNEIKCYVLEIISQNIDNFKEEMEYIIISLKCNKGFVGIYTDSSHWIWRHFALFKDLESRNDCYKRINEHFGEEKPRAAIVLESCYVDKKCIDKLS